MNEVVEPESAPCSSHAFVTCGCYAIRRRLRERGNTVREDLAALVEMVSEQWETDVGKSTEGR